MRWGTPRTKATPRPAPPNYARLREPLSQTALKIAFPALLFIFAVAMVVQAVQMTGLLAETNAQIYPIVVASLLAVGALGSLVGAVRGTDDPSPTAALTAGAVADAEPEASPSAGDQERENDHGGRKRVLIVLAASLAYPLVMPLLGFHLTTVLYAAGLSFLLQERSWAGAVKAVATGGGVTLFCHLAFIVVLDARLPTGQVF